MEKKTLINILVTVITFIIMLWFWIACTFAETYNITFAWDKNPEGDLAGYKLYSGPVSRMYIANPVATIMGDSNSYTLQIDTQNTLYFALTAFDIAGNESDYSNEAVFMVDANSIAPGPPQGYYIKNYIIIYNR